MQPTLINDAINESILTPDVPASLSTALLHMSDRLLPHGEGQLLDQQVGELVIVTQNGPRTVP